MRRTTIVGLCMALLFAVGALTAPSALAKEVLTLKTAKGALPAGAEVRGTSTNDVFVTDDGNIECTSTVLNATLDNNGASKDKALVSSISATGGEEGGACKSGLGAAFIFIRPIKTKRTELGWILGEFFEFTYGVALTANFATVGVECTWESKKVTSKFSQPGPMVSTTTEQVFKLAKKGSNSACPKEGRLSGTSELTSGGEAIEASV